MKTENKRDRLRPVLRAVHGGLRWVEIKGSFMNDVTYMLTMLKWTSPSQECLKISQQPFLKICNFTEVWNYQTLSIHLEFF